MAIKKTSLRPKAVEAPKVSNGKGKMKPETYVKNLSEDADLLAFVLDGLQALGLLGTNGGTGKAKRGNVDGTGVQIIAHTSADGQIETQDRKNRRGEVIGTNVNFIILNEDGEGDKGVPELAKLMSDNSCRWAPSQVFGGHPDLNTSTLKQASGRDYTRGQMFTDFEAFVSLVTSWDAVCKQEFIDV